MEIVLVLILFWACLNAGIWAFAAKIFPQWRASKYDEKVSISFLMLWDTVIWFLIIIL